MAGEVQLRYPDFSLQPRLTQIITKRSSDLSGRHPFSLFVRRLVRSCQMKLKHWYAVSHLSLDCSQNFTSATLDSTFLALGYCATSKIAQNTIRHPCKSGSTTFMEILIGDFENMASTVGSAEKHLNKQMIAEILSERLIRRIDQTEALKVKLQPNQNQLDARPTHWQGLPSPITDRNGGQFMITKRSLQRINLTNVITSRNHCLSNSRV